MRPQSILLLCALAAVPGPAAAQLLLPTSPGPQPPVSVRHADYRVTVENQVARATLTEVFENTGDAPLPGRFFLALPERAAVSSFATWVDGRRVESRVEAKAEARDTYERLARAGGEPGLLEKVAPGTFQAQVEAVPAGGTRRTEVGWSEVLPYQDGEVTLRVPLRVPGVDPVTFRALALEVRLHERTKRIGRVWSPTHRVTVDRDGERVVVHLEARDLRPEADLVLRYEVAGDAMGLAFMAHRPDPDGTGAFVLTVAPQELTTVEDIVQKDLVFVFDTSGSMAGPKMAQARAALHRCLGLLNRDDAFSILGFSDGLNPWQARVVEATPEHVEDARRFVDQLVDGGGTNLQGALLGAVDMVPDRGRPRVILFFTDGEPTVGETRPEAILAAVRKQDPEGTRLFTFGVEAEVNRALLDRLAREHRGQSAYVGRGQAIDTVVGDFYRGISRPVLADPAIDWGPATVSHTYPAILPDLYKGQQLLVVGRYRGEGQGTVVLTGEVNGARRRFELPVTFPAEAREDAVVERLWAQSRVAFLLEEMRLSGERAELREEVVRLARRHHLVTPYTSLITDPRPQVARLSPGRIKPGDPEVVVPAPSDARRVSVHLPFARTHEARWDVDREAWVARFLVPFGVPDGVYPVRVLVVHRDGRAERLDLAVTVDTRAPVLRVTLPDTARPGELVPLRARPVVSLPAVVQAVGEAGVGGAVEVAKTFADVKQVTAVLWDGREVELGVEPGGGWAAEVETPRDLPSGRLPVVITAVDWAGNLRRQTVHLTVVRG